MTASTYDPETESSEYNLMFFSRFWYNIYKLETHQSANYVKIQ